MCSVTRGDMLMQLWRLEYVRDGMNLDSLCLFLTNDDVSLLMRGILYTVVCIVVCYMAVKRGQ